MDSVLRRANRRFQGSTAIDVSRKILKHGFDAYAQKFSGCRFLQTKSSQYAPDRLYGLCFIDGDHSYQGAAADFSTFEHHAKYVAFHDIECPLSGIQVRLLWQQLRSRFPTTEFKNRDSRFSVPLGIGLVDLMSRPSSHGCEQTLQDLR
jgi:hypothetical protein